MTRLELANSDLEGQRVTNYTTSAFNEYNNIITYYYSIVKKTFLPFKKVKIVPTIVEYGVS